MNWFLILITWSGAITAAGFDTEASCLAAKSRMETIKVIRHAECVKK